MTDFATLIAAWLRDDESRLTVMASRWRTARSTVRRWAAGSTAPMSNLQAAIVRWMQENP